MGEWNLTFTLSLQFIRAPGDYMETTEKMTSHFDKKFAHVRGVITHGPICLPAAMQLMDGDGSYYMLPESLIERDNIKQWQVRVDDQLTNEVRDLFYAALKLALADTVYMNEDGWATARVQTGRAAAIPHIILGRVQAEFDTRTARLTDPALAAHWDNFTQLYTAAWLCEQVGAIAMPVLAHANHNGIASSSVVAFCNLALALNAAYTKTFRVDFASRGPKAERICGSPKAEPTACLINYVAAVPIPGDPRPLVTEENLVRNAATLQKAWDLPLNPSRRYHVDVAVKKGNFVGLMADVKHCEGEMAGLDTLCIAACKFLEISPVIILQSDRASIKFCKLFKEGGGARTVGSEMFQSQFYCLDRWDMSEHPRKSRAYGKPVENNPVDPNTLSTTMNHHACYIGAVMQVVDRLEVLLGGFAWDELAEKAAQSSVPDYVFQKGGAGSKVIPFQAAFRFKHDMGATWEGDMYTEYGDFTLQEVSNNAILAFPPKCPDRFLGCQTMGDLWQACCKPARGPWMTSFLHAHLVTSQITVKRLLQLIDEDLGGYTGQEQQAELGALRNIVNNSMNI